MRHKNYDDALDIAYSREGIHRLGLSKRAFNVLVNQGICLIEEAAAYSRRDLEQIENCGRTISGEIIGAIAKYRKAISPEDFAESLRQVLFYGA